MGVSGGDDLHSPLPPMRAALLGFIAAPLALLASGAETKAYPYHYSVPTYSYGNTQPMNYNYMINGRAGYQGRGYNLGNYHTYSDNYGSTTCSNIGQFINCW